VCQWRYSAFDVSMFEVSLAISIDFGDSTGDMETFRFNFNRNCERKFANAPQSLFLRVSEALGFAGFSIQKPKGTPE